MQFCGKAIVDQVWQMMEQAKDNGATSDDLKQVAFALHVETGTALNLLRKPSEATGLVDRSELFST